MNTKAKSKRIIHIIETSKTVLLGVLVISLVVLMAVYIRGIKVYEKVVEDGNDSSGFNKLWSVQGGIEPQGLDESRLIPEFIGYKQSSFITPRGCVGNTDAVSALYDLVKPCILELFGNGSICTELERTVGKALFTSAQSGEEFIYIRYHAPVLYQLIYAYGADRLMVAEEDVAAGESGTVGAYVSELIIISERTSGSSPTIAYAHDGEGNYYEFRPTEYAATSSFYISKLADSDSGITTSDFYFLTDKALDGAEPMIDSELLCSDITSSIVSFSDTEIKDSLFRLLGYNPDKLDVYDDKGADVYIDSHSRLRLGSGSVSFVTSDALAESDDDLRGITVDTLLGYTLDGAPTLFDKLTAADNFIRRLGDISPDLIGGEASLCLGDIYSEGGLLVIEYFLTYNNIRIGTDIHLRIVLTENTICEFELFPTTVGVGDTETLIPNPEFILRQLAGLGKLTSEKPADSVNLRYNSGSAEWTALLKP